MGVLRDPRTGMKYFSNLLDIKPEIFVILYIDTTMETTGRIMFSYGKFVKSK